MSIRQNGAQSRFSRRLFLQGSVALGTSYIGAPTGAQTALAALPVPPLLDATDANVGRAKLALTKGVHDFGTGAQSETFGINAPYLGPVIRVRSGSTFAVDVANQLDEAVALHWHGLHIEGQYDGGPHQEITPGETWSPNVPIAQPAGMSWFHSHTHGATARHVYSGLAGSMLIEDDDSLAADLPHTYGVDDFVIVLQDKSFNAIGQMSYNVTEATLQDGFEGEVLTVNGAIAPVSQTVPKGLVRLRILNACNGRFLTLSMADGPVNVIASDGGFLASLVETDTLTISSGERYEILIDLRTTALGELQVTFGDEVPGFFASLLNGRTTQTALTLTVGNDTGVDMDLPNQLANLSVPDRNAATLIREFSLDMGGDGGGDLATLAANWGNFCAGAPTGMGINGVPMNMERIDHTCQRGETEIWRITADQGLHPFHIHGCSFRILSQAGANPPSYAQGWKDMVYAEDGWSEVLVRFDHMATDDTPYMFHCHILEHEDCGMMGQFTVT